MVDDPDVLAILAEDDDTEDNSSERAKEETEFKKDIHPYREILFLKAASERLVNILHRLITMIASEIVVVRAGI